MPLKFVPLKDEETIDWIDGAKLKFKRPTQEEKDALVEKLPEEIKNDKNKVGHEITKMYLVGWENIEDGESGKPLEVNEKNKNEVYKMIQVDPDLAKKFSIFVRGPLGN